MSGKMVSNWRFTGEVTVKELLDNHPEVVQVFIDMNLNCVGCPTEGFHTLQEVAGIYAIDLKQFMQHIEQVIENHPSGIKTKNYTTLDQGLIPRKILYREARDVS